MRNLHLFITERNFYIICWVHFLHKKYAHASTTTHFFISHRPIMYLLRDDIAEIARSARSNKSRFSTSFSLDFCPTWTMPFECRFSPVDPCARSANRFRRKLPMKLYSTERRYAVGDTEISRCLSIKTASDSCARSSASSREMS